MELKNIVPWGRNLAEYRAMFSISAMDMKKEFLGCGDGPASFNAEMTQNGGKVVSIDPIYEFSAAELRGRIDETYETVLNQVKKDPSPYIWTSFSDPEAMAEARMKAMNDFLDDYEKGRREKRYVKGELPSLPFPDDSFDIALSSHFLFLYSQKLSLDFHIAAITEMLRVAGELRIFPLFNLDNSTSDFVKPVKNHFSDMGFKVSLLKVPYEFQRGADTMMKLSKNHSI